MPRSPTKSSPKRKGVLLSDKPIEMEAKTLANKKAAELGTECKEIRKYSNGAIGVYFTNGKFLFVRGATKEFLEKARAKRTSPEKQVLQSKQKGGSKSKSTKRKSQKAEKKPKRKSQQKGSGMFDDEEDEEVEYENEDEYEEDNEEEDY